MVAGPATGWASLTPTELDVARLAATGIGNAAIGKKLFIAAGTVQVHPSHIYAKLGIGKPDSADRRGHQARPVEVVVSG